MCLEFFKIGLEVYEKNGGDFVTMTYFLVGSDFVIDIDKKEINKSVLWSLEDEGNFIVIKNRLKEVLIYCSLDLNSFNKCWKDWKIDSENSDEYKLSFLAEKVRREGGSLILLQRL